MKITGREFESIIKKDPSWCKNLKEEVEVTTFVDLSKSKITHLSPFITFSGIDKQGRSADFENCKNLEAATGTFQEFVDFSYSGVTTIKDLIIKNPNKNKDKAAFFGCPIKYASKEYRNGEFLFEEGIIYISNRKDEINKIKSEANNIEL